jgi:uncharacterized protein (UPF0212 family)
MADTGKPQQHTPGPWAPEESFNDYQHVDIRGNGRTKLVAVVYMGNDCSPTEEERANAALIAAAPELLAALVALDAGLATQAESDGHAAGLRRIARAAIAAATDRLPAERSEQATEGGTP